MAGKRVNGHLTANMGISWLNFVSFLNNLDSKFGDMAAKVALQNFDIRYATLLFFNSTLYYGVEVFLREFSDNVIVNKGTFNPNLANTTHQFVLFADNVDDIEQILNNAIQIKMDNTGKFIIICQSSKKYDCDENIIAKLLWENKIVNVVFIKEEKEESTQVAGYTYYPIADGVCSNTTPVKLKHNQYTNTTYGEVYRMKLKNLKLCPLFVSTFIQTPYMYITNGTPTGADGDLLRIIAYGLNSSLQVMTPRHGDGWGFLQDNGTWMGSLADLSENIANFSMTSPAITSSRYADFQISECYYTINVVWVTHPAKLENAALKLFRPFQAQTQVALVISFFLVVLCAFIVKTESWMFMCRKIAQAEPTKSIVFYAWMICMGQAVVRMPTKSAFLQVTLIWVWYCFLIRTAYQVYLISSLKGKFYEEEFESIEDVISAQYTFGGGSALKDYYVAYPHICDNWINVDAPQIVPILLNISKGMKFALAMNKETAKMIIKKYEVALKILPQKVATSPTAIFFKKYSPLQESVSLILSRLIAGGFPDKLHKIYTSVRKINRNDDEEETMKMVHFTACYVLMILGWILSLIFFGLEFYFGKIYQHPSQDL